METIRHQSMDLFDGAERWGDAPRFFLPNADHSAYTPVTWQQYASDTEALGGHLCARIKPGDSVAIMGQTSYAWIVAYSATQAVRGVVVPIYPASTPDMIAYFLEHGECRTLLCDASFLPVLSQISLAGVEEVILLDDGSSVSELKVPVTPYAQALETGAMRQAAFASVRTEWNPDDLATIIYTSGTTGLPKGVMLSHANLYASSKDWISLNGPMIPENAVDLHWLPLAHAFGIGAIMLGNILGWQSWFATPKNVLSKFPEIRPHTFLSVPAYWEKLYLSIQAQGGDQAAFEKVTGGRLVFGLSGGAGLKKEIKEGFYALGLLVIEGYGLTECSPTLTMNRRDKFNFDSVGVPYPSVEVKLAEDGEILAKGPNVFRGYFKNEQATRDTFDDEGWFKTGDIGRWTEDGFLQIIDRKKEILVTSGGKNVPPANIERHFQDNPYVQHLIVYGDGKKFLTALVTLEEPAVREAVGDQQTAWSELVQTPAVKTLIDQQVAQVNGLLASYETIKKVHISALPLTVEGNLLTASLKPRRKAIYEHFGPQLEALYA